MATLLTILITAVVAIVATFVAKNFFSVERKLDYNSAPISLADATFQRCMAHLLGPPLVGGNRVVTLLNGDEIFPAMLAALRKAEQSITFETYIYWSGKIGRELSEVLAERARAGVCVHVLLDWVGSARLDADAVGKMIEAGVEVEKYRPLRWYNLSRVNSRTHRKIMVVDGR